MIGLLLLQTAQAGMPVDAGVRVLVRVLAYDRALHDRAGDMLRIGIVYDRADPLSATQARDVSDVLVGMGVTVAGLSIAEPVLLDHQGPWADRLGEVSVLVVCRGIEGSLPALAAVASERDLPVLALDPTAVGAGAAIGVEQRSAHIEILVDLVVARSQGMELSSEVLQLSRIVGNVPPR